MLNRTSNGCVITAARELCVLNRILSTETQDSWDSSVCFFVLPLAAANGIRACGAINNCDHLPNMLAVRLPIFAGNTSYSSVCIQQHTKISTSCLHTYSTLISNAVEVFHLQTAIVLLSGDTYTTILTISLSSGTKTGAVLIE